MTAVLKAVLPAQKAATRSAFSPARHGILQRKCACGGNPGVDGECEGCRQKRLQRKASTPQTGGVAPPIVHEVLRTPGEPLDLPTRAFMEPRFGFDLSQVRIHSDAKATNSARAVNALAYTVRQDVVFGAGQYRPSDANGRKLLAHELAHSVQQSSHGGGPSGQIPVGRPDDDAEQAADQVAERVMATSLPQSREPAKLRSSPSASRTTNGMLRRRTVARDYDTTASEQGSLCHVTLRITGAPDDQSPAVTEFVEAAMDGVRSACGSLAAQTSYQLRVSIPYEAGLDHGTVSQRAYAAARASVLGAPPAAQTPPAAGGQSGTVVESPVIEGISCPPTKVVAAKDLVDYTALLGCAEKQMSLGPREMLAVFRQIYYGKPWSVSTTAQWDQVIPCSPAIGDPRPRLGSVLFDSLFGSQEVAGVDAGHVFTGLESMLCPSATVTPKAPGATGWAAGVLGLTQINMANEDFATWGGDLGAAVAAKAACDRLGSAAASSDDCGKTASGQSLNFYLKIQAPDQDLEGDIDPFAIRAQAAGIPCGGSMQKTATLPAGKISELFESYYLDPTSLLGKAHANRAACMLEALGATLSGKNITNRAAVVAALQPHIYAFAEAFYYKIRGTTVDSGESGLMRIVYSPFAAEWFLNWLVKRL